MSGIHGSNWVKSKTVKGPAAVNWGPQQNGRGMASKPMMEAVTRPASIAAKNQMFETGLPALNPDLIVGARASYSIDTRDAGTFQSWDARGEVLEVLQAKARRSAASYAKSFGGAGMDPKTMARLDNDKRAFAALKAFNSQSAGGARKSSQAPQPVRFAP